MVSGVTPSLDGHLDRTTALAVIATIVVTALPSCGRSSGRPPKPLGELPHAVTTAEPLWLPFAIRAGHAATADPRERHFAELRRLTSDGATTAVTWSPDGHHLLLELAARDAPCGTVVELDLETGAISPGAPTNGWAQSPAYDVGGDTRAFAWLPAPSACTGGGLERSVAFAAPRPSAGIYTVRDGSLRPLIAGPAADLAVSARSARVAFCSTRDGNAEIYVATANGAEIARVTHDDAYQGMPSFSPDGEKLAWQAAGSAEPMATPSHDRAREPSQQRPRLGIVVAGSAGQHAEWVVEPVGLNLGPTFFPDSRRLMFASDREAMGTGDTGTRNFELYAVDPEGPVTANGRPPIERLTYAPAFDGWATFSPDGRYVAFVSGRARADGGGDAFVARWAD